MSEFIQPLGRELPADSQPPLFCLFCLFIVPDARLKRFFSDKDIPLSQHPDSPSGRSFETVGIHRLRYLEIMYVTGQTLTAAAEHRLQISTI